MTTVVWFKRDLRTRDHEPLVAAARLGEPIIPLYVVEDEYWQLPDTSERQWAFVRDSLGDLDRQLKQAGNRLIIRTGVVTDVLRELKASHNIQRIFCHQEPVANGRLTVTDR